MTLIRNIIICSAMSLLGFVQIKAQHFAEITRGAYASNEVPKILVVDNLGWENEGNEATGRGTLNWCLRREYPRIVLFEVAGVIDSRAYNSNISVKNPYLTVLGQSSPGGITLRGSSIDIYASDVIIQNLAVRIGDDPEGTEYNGRDCFYINADRVVIDRCSFSWSIDELASISRCKDILISHCIFSEPLHKSYHYNEAGTGEPEVHGYAVLATEVENFYFIKNLIAYSTSRNPMIQSGSSIVANNFMYNALGTVGPTYYSHDNKPVRTSFVSNQVIRLDQSTWSGAKYAATLSSNVSSASEIYVDDNISLKTIEQPSTSDWDNIYNKSGASNTNVSPMDLSQFDILPSNEIENYLNSHVGSFAWDRDEVDSRIIEQIQSRNGSVINSPFSLPAIAHAWNDNSGDFSEGRNWASAPSSFYVDGQKINLNQNCTGATPEICINKALNLVNSQLPSSIEAYQLNGGHYIALRTKSKGSDQHIEISQSDINDLGIPDGDYYGSDGVGGYPQIQSTYRSIGEIEGLPIYNPHGNSLDNGYTDMENWGAGVFYAYQDQMEKKPIYKVVRTQAGILIRNSNIETPYQLELFDSSGRLLFQKKDIIGNEYKVPMNNSNYGVYIIRIKDRDRKLVFTKEIII